MLQRKEHEEKNANMLMNFGFIFTSQKTKLDDIIRSGHAPQLSNIIQDGCLGSPCSLPAPAPTHTYKKKGLNQQKLLKNIKYQ